MRRATCSCGRAEVEQGCDLCAYCRADHEEAAYRAERQAEYEAWLNEQGPG